MKLIAFVALAATAAAGAALAQKNTELNATCNDGTHYQGAVREGACAAHGGVQKWLESTTIAGPNEATVVGTKGTNSPPPTEPSYKEPNGANAAPNSDPDHKRQ